MSICYISVCNVICWFVILCTGMFSFKRWGTIRNGKRQCSSFDSCEFYMCDSNVSDSKGCVLIRIYHYWMINGY
jgi:hypothetical protein